MEHLDVVVIGAGKSIANRIGERNVTSKNRLVRAGGGQTASYSPS